MYQNGRGVPQDDTEAVAWYRKAANQGLALAQTNLGWMYDNGRGVAKDDAQTSYWYRKAADQGEAYAQNNLGMMYANGRGVAKDDTEAVAWYRKAADQGLARAERARPDVPERSGRAPERHRGCGLVSQGRREGQCPRADLARRDVREWPWCG